MKKFLIILLFLSFSLSGCGNDNNSSNNQEETNNYTTYRTISIDDSTNGTMNNADTTTNDSNNTKTNSTINNNNASSESELSAFSTKIYTPDDKARQNNIRITCSKLDGIVVKARRNIFFL